MRYVFILLCLFTTALSACGDDASSNNTKAEKDSADAKMLNDAPLNKFLYQNSDYPIIHFDVAQTDNTALAMWKGAHTVTEENIDFIPLTWASRSTVHKVYPDGSQALLCTGNAEVAKIKIEDRRLKMVNQLIAPGQEAHYATPAQTTALVKTMDANYMKEDGYIKPLLAFLEKHKQSSETGSYGVYSLIDKDGFLYAGYGTTLVKYGDQGNASAASPLVLTDKVDLRDHLPKELAAKIHRFLGINMTYDGNIAVAMPGLIAVVSRDLKQVWTCPIPGEIVDNGISLDEKGGIYVVTDKFMRKMVWTGSKLSLEEADGAWKESYPYDASKKALWLSHGSGATPSLMGFGDAEDHLVVLSDAGSPVKIMAFWRDAIPADAKQVQGAATKRMAAATKIDFPVATTIEWSLQVYRDGVMAFASDFPDPVLLSKEQVFPLTLLSMGYTRKGAKGAQCFTWNAKNKSLDSRWLYEERPMTWTLGPVSRASNAVYLNTLDNGDPIIIGKDWTTGEEIAKIQLPKTFKVNTCGQFVYPLRNGDLVLSGAFGPVLIRKQ
jgi:hypothetical protein